MVEAEFFLELLVRLLADPARLDRRGQRLEAGFRRQVREIVFLLAGGAPLAALRGEGCFSRLLDVRPNNRLPDRASSLCPPWPEDTKRRVA